MKKHIYKIPLFIIGIALSIYLLSLFFSNLSKDLRSINKYNEKISQTEHLLNLSRHQKKPLASFFFDLPQSGMIKEALPGIDLKELKEKKPVVQNLTIENKLLEKQNNLLREEPSRTMFPSLPTVLYAFGAWISAAFFSPLVTHWSKRIFRLYNFDKKET